MKSDRLPDLEVVTPMQYGESDPLFAEAAAALPIDEKMPVSFLQRRFRLGYGRAFALNEALTAARDSSPGNQMV